MSLSEDALRYHELPIPGKTEVVPTKPCQTQRDLSLAYSPGVAEPCRVIQKDPLAAYKYTNKGNLVAVVTNGTAVLGLGNIGALAGKPVMEGKGVLFKRFAGVDVFDIELDCSDPEQFIAAVKAMEPTFGGINLEDVKAPECFYIEQRLTEEMDIPVFHDDQHGTAIISCAGLLNALEIQEKKIEEIRVVIGGAGAAAIAITNLAIRLGVDRKNVMMCDSRGVIHDERTNLTETKLAFAHKTSARTLADAMEGADVFLGVSVAGTVTADMVRSMAPRPIIFALANPDPEIPYPEAREVRSDLIMATGRSDYPNQVNNVLGFPYVFRGALDVRARKISEEMKLAAVHALADLTHLPVPDDVLRAYNISSLEFGPEYIIPKPFDPRVLTTLAPAVAKAACDSGVARQPIHDWDGYVRQLEKLQGPSYAVIEPLRYKAQELSKRLAFAEGEEVRIIRAARTLADQGICRPVLVGRPETIEREAAALGFSLDGIEVHDPHDRETRDAYAERLWKLRERKGVHLRMAKQLVRNRNYYTMMMHHEGRVDGVLSGYSAPYPEVLRPALQVLGKARPNGVVSGVYAMAFRNRVLFFGDCTVNIQPTAKQLAAIAYNTAAVARTFHIEPRVAFLSFSNFGDVRHERVDKVREALTIIRASEPDFEVEGEMQANVALNVDLRERVYPFAKLTGEPTVLIFPDLQSGNIAYKLLESLGGATAIGPILVGVGGAVTVLQMGSTVDTIVDMATITANMAQQPVEMA